MSIVLDYVSELRQPTGLFFIPQVMEDHGGMISTRENSWFVRESSLKILSAAPSSSK
jgi:hypothetical protein